MPRNYLISILLLLLSWSSLAGQSDISLLSWNIRDLGKSKDDSEIKEIARIMNAYDIVAVQEVVAGPGGAQAVARLADQLNRMGNKWDYRISNPTRSPKYKTERYAYLWKTNKCRLKGRPWLASSFEERIYREPYLARFQVGDQSLLLVNYHSRRFDERPEEEIVFICQLPQIYEGDFVVIAGDFNCKADHPVFDHLKNQDYQAVLDNTPTTLKKKCKNGKYTNHPIDNIFLPSEGLSIVSADIVDFVGYCEALEAARFISDHLPVAVTFNFHN